MLSAHLAAGGWDAPVATALYGVVAMLQAGRGRVRAARLIALLSPILSLTAYVVAVAGYGMTTNS